MLWKRIPKGGGSEAGGRSGRGGSISSGSFGGRSGSEGVSGTGRGTTKGYGGGKITTVPEGKPFAGRGIGGGNRDQIYGTAAYGSGYPYGAGNSSSTVAGRPFPFGYWPLYVLPPLPGSQEYGGSENTQRTGGRMTTSQVKGAAGSIHDVYFLIGDNDSVSDIGKALNKSSCLATAVPLVDYMSNTDVDSSEIIQWYRASSFALALQGFNNSETSFKLNATSFLSCINKTIGDNLPIMSGKRGLSEGEQIGIVFGTVVGAAILFFVGLCIFECCKVCKATGNRRASSYRMEPVGSSSAYNRR